MALTKRITQVNGISYYYHRVVGISSYVNTQNVIEVRQYTSKAKRQEENDWYASEDPERPALNIVTNGVYYDVPYQDGMTLEQAYEYLMSLPEYEGATDAGTGE